MKKLPEPSEFEQQCSIFRWAELLSGEYPMLKRLVGSANGVRVGIGNAMKLKRSGCLPKGYPDLFLPYPIRTWHGLFIELKKKDGGSVSEEQKDWIYWLQGVGYYACVCWGEDECKETIMRYITGEV